MLILIMIKTMIKITIMINDNDHDNDNLFDKLLNNQDKLHNFSDKVLKNLINIAKLKEKNIN